MSGLTHLHDRPSDLPPGSDAAIAAGCRCPILDNAHGAGYRVIRGVRQYVLSEGCPLHMPVVGKVGSR